MTGFFTKQETESATRPGGKTLSCASCQLYKDSRNSRMKPYGNFKKDILIIGEFPSSADDRIGKPFQDGNGKFLQNRLKEIGIDLFEDCLTINAVNCNTKDKPPTSAQIECCRSIMIQKVMKQHAPLVTVLLGTVAIESFLGHRWQKDLGGINKWRGWEIPDQDYRCWVLPVFTPKWVRQADREVQTIWRNDLKKIPELVDKKFLKHKEPEIIYLDDLSPLENIKSGQIAFDYETTGLKPHAQGHRIVCASVAVDENKVYSFMMPLNRKDRKPFTDLLQNPDIGKIAHNIKFEDTWTNHRLRVPVVSWDWDSMLAAHIIDNRQGVTGLKFQTYVNFGIMGYDSEVAPYLKGVPKEGEKKAGGNSINTVDELLRRPGGKELLLKYVALDSIYEYRLAREQLKLINYSFLPF